VTRSELERFTLAMAAVRTELNVQQRTLTARDLHLLQAGMRAIFVVEAKAHGDDARVTKHAGALAKLLQAGAPVSGIDVNEKAANDG
jgi:hypothetical protein